MFTTARPAAFGRPHHLANAYAQVAVETSVNSASAHRLIALLFDGYIDALMLARAAMRAGHIEQKGRSISHAVRLIDEGLKASLNLQEGGKLADDLASLYAYTVVRLTYANLHNDERALDECEANILPLRDAWKSIGPQVEAGKA